MKTVITILLVLWLALVSATQQNLNRATQLNTVTIMQMVQDIAQIQNQLQLAPREQVFRLASSTKRQTNSIGIIAEIENRNQYMFGSVTGGSVFKLDDKVYTEIVFNPVNTPSLFTQQVTFCGDQASEFQGKLDGLVVVTYSRVQHRRDCYDLYRVDRFKGGD